MHANSAKAAHSEVKDFALFSSHPALFTSVVSIAYFLGARIGFALTVGLHPISLMWPPNTILLAGLLLTPTRFWTVILLAVLPSHLAAEWESHVPLRMVLCWFVSNSSEALIGAGLIRFFIREQLRFDQFRCVCLFYVCGVLLAPLASSFIDAGLVRLNHWGKDPYWELWRVRSFSNIFASATVGVAVLTWVTGGPRPKLPPVRAVEAGLLLLGLVSVVSLMVLYSLGAGLGGLWLYAPWPFLLWAALRFGTRGASAAILIVSTLIIWSVVHEHQQFLTVDEQNVRSIQVFFLVMSLTLMPLASVLQEREKVDRELRASQQRYREVVETQPNLICRFLPDTTLTFVNLTYSRFFQRPREDLIGRRFLDLVPAAAHEYFMLMIASVITERRTVVREHEVFLPRGGVGWHQWINQPIVDEDGNIREIQAIGRDITASRRTEAALREVTERNQAMLKAIPDSIFLVDKAGVFLDCHSQEESLLTLPAAQCLGHHVRDILPRELATELQRCFGTVLRTGKMAMAECAINIRGKRRCYEARFVQCGYDKLLTVIRDITEQKRANEELKDSEERYREVVESQTELVSRCKPDTTLTFANEAFCRFFVQARKSLIGRKLLQLLPPALHAKVLRGMAEVMHNRREAHWEHLFTLPDGDARWLQWTNYAIVDSNGEVKEIQGIGKDITDRKRAEEAKQDLIHASRLAVIGEFTAMIAHEVNQPLSAILANAEAAEALMKQPIVPWEEIRAILPDIHQDTLRARDTINRMRALCQKREIDIRPLDLNNLIEDVVQLVSGDASRRHVQVRTELAPDLPAAQADPIHIQHILLNFILNGMEAMNSVPESERLLIIQTEDCGNKELAVAVRDTGHGISPDIMPRVFESFFSTKSSGLGLGLSIARTIIRAHHGEISVTNNTRRGVTVRFTLPLAT